MIFQEISEDFFAKAKLQVRGKLVQVWRDRRSDA